jgi:hypothetical protein
MNRNPAPCSEEDAEPDLRSVIVATRESGASVERMSDRLIPVKVRNDHWKRAIIESNTGGYGGDVLEVEEKVLAGLPDANMPALLTKDVPGG